MEKNAGYCHCCRTATNFIITGEWLRDQYLCETCGSIPRQRHLQWVLDKFFEGWEDFSIHESSPSNEFIARLCPGYSSSQFFEDHDMGSEVAGVRCENLESLTFPDNHFDLFLTQDVFEHIFNPGQAAAEILRVLKPGGAHVFTAPKHRGLHRSHPRAKLEESGVEYLMDKLYHGSPIGDGRVLVTWDYGDDFEFLMHQWCGQPTATYITHDRSLGIDGEFIEVFVTRKMNF